MRSHTCIRQIATAVTLGTAAAAGGLSGEAGAEPLWPGEGTLVTVDGGYAVSDFSQTYFDRKGGDFSVEDDTGFFGAVSVAGALADRWDWRASAVTLDFSRNSKTVVTEAPAALVDVTQDRSAFIADIEAGYHQNFGATSARFGIGLLTTRQEYELSQSVSLASFDASLIHKYRGTGPKISADLSHPVTADGRLRVIGGGSLAYTDGHFDMLTTVEDFSGGGVFGASAVVSMAYLGMELQQSEALGLRAGVRFDRFAPNLDRATVPEDRIGLFDNDADTTTAFVGLGLRF